MRTLASAAVCAVLLLPLIACGSTPTGTPESEPAQVPTPLVEPAPAWDERAVGAEVPVPDPVPDPVLDPVPDAVSDPDPIPVPDPVRESVPDPDPAPLAEPDPVVVGSEATRQPQEPQVPKPPFTVGDLRRIYAAMRQDIRDGRLDRAERRYELVREGLDVPSEDPRRPLADDVAMLGGFVRSMRQRESGHGR